MTQTSSLPAFAVRQSPIEGRGLFAVRSISSDEQIGMFHLLLLSANDTEILKPTLLHHYVFHVRDEPDGRPCVAVAFGEISFCNHSRQPNAAFRVDGQSQTVTLTALSDIGKGAEILIDYEEYADEIL